MYSLNQLIEKLKQNHVIAYPTEAVFGLGCNPNSEQAVNSLLTLKQRPKSKGLILIAPEIDYFLPYIDETSLSKKEWSHFSAKNENAITWIVPAKCSVPSYLKGNFTSIALRLCKIPTVIQLCEALGSPLTSTSANLSGYPPCRTAQEVLSQFGKDFPVINEPTSGRANPSEIRDIFTQHIFRKG